MRYNYQTGITADRRGFGPFWIFVLILIFLSVIGYGGFVALVPSLGGWPVKSGDEAAQSLHSVPPGEDGNRLFIPKINVSAAIDQGRSGVQLTGSPAEDVEITASGPRSGFGITPEHRLSASPFYRLNRLEQDDEVYIDFDGTRYAYTIAPNQDEAQLVIESDDGKYIVYAKKVGIVNWNNGEPQIEVQDESSEDAPNGINGLNGFSEDLGSDENTDSPATDEPADIL